MRTMLLASASLLLVAGTALAQNSTGSPMSNSATHTSAANTKGAIAPRLPISADDASINQFLTHAQTAVRRGRTGEAQEALERAETRVLTRSTTASTAGTPDADPRVASIEAARQALGRGDKNAAMQSINAAMTTGESASTGSMPMGTMPTGTNSMPMGSTGTTMGATGATPMMNSGPAPAAGTNPNSLGGIANGIGSASGTGEGTRSRPQASFSGPGPGESPGGTNGAPAVGGAPLIPPTSAPTTTP